ncbi:MAG TPA: hypothetical protein VF240_02530, partial [Pyrinomonadaceae bacterium]
YGYLIEEIIDSFTKRAIIPAIPLNHAASTNGRHPTANSAALIENLGGVGVECAAGDAGR